jgi:hypothetical protein
MSNHPLEEGGGKRENAGRKAKKKKDAENPAGMSDNETSEQDK